MQWVTHEVWLPDGRELAFVDWPHAVRAVDAATGSVRTLAEFNAWHAAPSPDGRSMVADTVHPNVGLQLFPVRGGPARLTVCASGASIEANPCCIECGGMFGVRMQSWRNVASRPA